MPKPGQGEPEDDFIDRCMGDNEARTDFPSDSQRRAFCQSQWDNRNKSGVSWAGFLALLVEKQKDGERTPCRDEKGKILVREGDNIEWQTLGGDLFMGEVIELDSNVAIVRCLDGKIRAVEV